MKPIPKEKRRTTRAMASFLTKLDFVQFGATKFSIFVDKDASAFAGDNVAGLFPLRKGGAATNTFTLGK